MTRKKVLILLGSVVLALMLVVPLVVACAAPTPSPTPSPSPTPGEVTYSWRLASGAADPMHIAYMQQRMFGTLLEERSDGRITVSLYPGSILGDWTVQNEMVAEGSLDMAVVVINPALDKRLNVNALNYVYFDNAGARDAFLLPDGWLSKMLEPILANVNVKLLGTGHNGWVGVHLTKGNRPRVDTVDNWFADVAKIKIRVEPVTTMQKHTEAMGFKGVVLPFAEVYTALQLGTIDGWVGSGISRAVQYSDVIRYRIEQRGKVDMHALIMNQELWNSLSTADKELVQDVAWEVQEYGYDVWEDMEATVWPKKTEEVDVEIVELSPTVLAEIIKRDRDLEWTYAEEELIGKEFMDQVRAKAQKPPA